MRAHRTGAPSDLAARHSSGDGDSRHIVVAAELQLNLASPLDGVQYKMMLRRLGGTGMKGVWEDIGDRNRWRTMHALKRLAQTRTDGSSACRV